MKQNTTLKYLFLSAAAALALAVSARAGGMPEATPVESTTPVHQGLLGQQYANLTYSYIDLDRSPVNADNFEFAVNQPLNTGLDAVFAYDWTQTGLFAGSRLNTQSLTAGLRAFGNAYTWGKPYVEADAGYAWQRGTPAGHDNSVLWRAALGAELQLAPAFTVTPYVQYTDTPSLAGNDNGTWDFGVKANYWIDSQWAVTAGLARSDNHDNRFTVGTNFRF
jgi:hypothetical protein